MFLSRIRVNPQALHSSPQLPPLDTPYREHQLLWQLFDHDPDADRDFLFRRDGQAHQPGFYLLSQRQPVSPDGIWHIESKHYKPVLHSGQKLACSLHANPVVTRRDANGKTQRHDLVMDLKVQTGWHKQEPDQRPPLQELIQQAGEQWLATRLVKHGAELNHLRAEGYQQHRLQKKGKGNPIRISTLDLTGLLTVADPDAFARILYTGLGPAKAFGCGLLLIRHP